MDDLVDAVVDRVRTADREQHDRDEKSVEEAFPAVPERVLHGFRPVRPVPANEQQDLVAAVRYRVDELGQHRR